MKLHDDTFHFKGFGNCDSRCRLRIYQVNASLPERRVAHLHHGDKVVILTQLEGDVGTSVTNASEIIANAVAEQFKLEPLRTVWIEHYPNWGPAGHSIGESFDRVTYDYKVERLSVRPDQWEVRCAYFSARWNRITREIVADLIGEQP